MIFFHKNTLKNDKKRDGYRSRGVFRRRKNHPIYNWHVLELKKVKYLFYFYKEFYPIIFSKEVHTKEILNVHSCAVAYGKNIKFVFDFLILYYPEIFSKKNREGQTFLESFFNEKFSLFTTFNGKVYPPSQSILEIIKFTNKHFSKYFRQENLFTKELFDLTITRDCINLILENNSNFEESEKENENDYNDQIILEENQTKNERPVKVHV